MEVAVQPAGVAPNSGIRSRPRFLFGLLARTDARGVSINYVYDPLNRMTSATSSTLDPPLRYWTYGPVGDPAGFRGRLKVAVADGLSMTEYLGYDSMGRVTQSRQGTAGVFYMLNYTYNLAGGLETQTYPSGRQTKACYDASGQPDKVEGKSPWNLSLNADYLTSASYGVHGAPETMNRANGTVESRGYDPATLQPTSVSLAKSGASLLTLGLCYTCGLGNSTGNVRQQTITIPGESWTQNYGYDAYNRLQTATESGVWSQTYVYDGWGNRAVLAGSWVPNTMWTPQTPGTGSVPYGSNNRWTGAIYDNAGNVTQVGTAAMTYDGESRQKSGGGATYFYDADGRRVQRKRSTNPG